MIVKLVGLDGDKFGIELSSIVSVRPLTGDSDNEDKCALTTIDGTTYGIKGSVAQIVAFLNASTVHLKKETRRLVEEPNEPNEPPNEQHEGGPIEAQPAEVKTTIRRIAEATTPGDGLTPESDSVPPRTLLQAGLAEIRERRMKFTTDPLRGYVNEQYGRRPRIGQNRIIRLTETTVQELSRAVMDARKEKAKPDGSIDVEAIYVESPYKADKFRIEMEQKPRTQESCGYRLSGADYPRSRPQAESEVP